jgi:hypothetical protein
MRPVIYTCITRGYDELAPVDPDWDCDFIAFHDGTIEVPEGWTGRHLRSEGLAGVDLNRFAKMLPHRLDLPSERSLYVDGNILFKVDPRPEIDRLLQGSLIAARVHPERDCLYSEMRHALEIGFMSPLAAWRLCRQFRSWGVPQKAGLFEANLLYRQHEHPAVRALDEAWWSLWRQGLRRDQPLLVAASWQAGLSVTPITTNDVHDPNNPMMGIIKHRKPRDFPARLRYRALAELCLFRAWLPRDHFATAQTDG